MTKPDIAFERKQQIVQATVECISKFGYHNFSMQDVAKTAGVSKGIIHYYFLNKDDLMMSVLEKVAEDITSTLHQNMKSSKDPAQQLEIFITTSLNIVRTSKEYYQVNMDFWAQINQKQKVREIILEHYKEFKQTVLSVLEAGILVKVFKEVDVASFGNMIIAMIDGLSLQWLFAGETPDCEKTTAYATAWILDSLRK